jgi:hypothetical protein
MSDRIDAGDGGGPVDWAAEARDAKAVSEYQEYENARAAYEALCDERRRERDARRASHYRGGWLQELAEAEAASNMEALEAWIRDRDLESAENAAAIPACVMRSTWGRSDAFRSLSTDALAGEGVTREAWKSSLGRFETKATRQQSGKAGAIVTPERPRSRREAGASGSSQQGFAAAARRGARGGWES